MNSKVLQDKIKGIESHQVEMRLVKKEKHEDNEHHSAISKGCQSSVSLKHYDQVISC